MKKSEVAKILNSACPEDQPILTWIIARYKYAYERDFLLRRVYTSAGSYTYSPTLEAKRLYLFAMEHPEHEALYFRNGKGHYGCVTVEVAIKFTHTPQWYGETHRQTCRGQFCKEIPTIVPLPSLVAMDRIIRCVRREMFQNAKEWEQETLERLRKNKKDFVLLSSTIKELI